MTGEGAGNATMQAPLRWLGGLAVGVLVVFGVRWCRGKMGRDAAEAEISAAVRGRGSAGPGHGGGVGSLRRGLCGGPTHCLGATLEAESNWPDMADLIRAAGVDSVAYVQTLDHGRMDAAAARRRSAPGQRRPGSGPGHGRREGDDPERPGPPISSDHPGGTIGSVTPIPSANRRRWLRRRRLPVRVFHWRGRRMPTVASAASIPRNRLMIPNTATAIGRCNAQRSTSGGRCRDWFVLWLNSVGGFCSTKRRLRTRPAGVSDPKGYTSSIPASCSVRD